MRSYVRHVAGEMNDMVQQCVICGTIISDYRNVMVPNGQSFPKGFPAGEIFVSEGNPTIMSRLLSDNETFTDCK